MRTSLTIEYIMAQQQSVFDYVILLNDDKAKKSTILAEGRLLASNVQKAQFAVIGKIPKEHVENLDNIEVLVRPF